MAILLHRPANAEGTFMAESIHTRRCKTQGQACKAERGETSRCVWSEVWQHHSVQNLH